MRAVIERIGKFSSIRKKGSEFWGSHAKLCFWNRLLAVNIIVFGIVMLLFEQTTKSDDYDMCNVLYGGVNGEYSSFILYVNFLLGCFLKFLTSAVPNVSWYFVIQNLSIFCGFCAITYVLMKKNMWNRFLLVYTILMSFAAYEVYVRITFSKTGALLIAAGLLLILYAIDEKCGGIKYLAGFMLIFLGILWRSGMLKLVVGMFFSVYILLVVQSWKKWDKEFWRKTVCFVVATLTVLLMGTVVNKVQAYAFNNDEVWHEYIQFNTVRSSVLDYGWPDYESFEDEYQKIGISENDYIMWSQYANIADPDRFTEEKLKQIREIYKVSEDEPLYLILADATRHLPVYLINNTMFYLLLSCVVILLVCGKKRNYWIAGLVSLCWLIAYYYMYYRGRLQNHVDASIAIVGAVVCLYYASEKDGIDKKRVVKIGLPVSLIFIMAINHFYDDITTSNYLGAYYGVIESQKEFSHQNYEKMSLLSEDEEHLYVISAYETHTIYPCFAPDEIIEKGFYHNIFRLNQYTIPVFRQPLVDYGIDNPFADIVNNESVYYCVSQSREFEIDRILQYIKENYAQDAYYTLVKDIEGLHIYRFNEGDLQIELSDVIEDSGEVTQKIDWYIGEDQRLAIWGYAYMEETDSYAQNIYVEIKDKVSGNSKFYYALQTENEQRSLLDKYAGKYGEFEANIDIKDIDLQNAEVNVLLENEKGLYRIPTNIGEE